MSAIKTVRIIWISALVGIVGFLLYKTITPFGVINYQSNFLSFNYFISDLSPVERLVSQSRFDNRVSGEPIYFYLRTPRPFRTATVTLTLRNPAPLVELGICRDKTAWNFERQPIYVEGLEKLASHPETFQENGLLLWQREKKYNSVQQFLESLPSAEKITTYNYQLPTQVRLSDYQPAKQARTITTGLRGGYVALTYSGGEPLEMNITVHRELKNKDNVGTSLRWTVYNEQGEGIISQELPSLADSTPTTISLKTPAVRAGLYRLEFKAEDDIITDTITTPQTKLSFVNKVSLASQDRSNLSLLTDASYLKAQTLNPERLQTITIGQQTLSLTETYRQFSVILDDQSRAVKPIALPADDVLLAGDGVFAFTPEDIINPTTRHYNPEMNIDRAGIDYVIARYEPLGEGTSYTRTVSFSLNQNCLDKGRYPLVIAASGLNPEQPMTVERVDVKLTGQTLGEFIRKLWTHR